MLFREATVRASDGTQLFYRIAGTGPTTLLFLHGWGGSDGIPPYLSDDSIHKWLELAEREEEGYGAVILC